METLGNSLFEVTYNGKDISKDISQYLISMRYVDKTGKEADELSLTLENVDGLWENDWYPEKGAKLTAKIGDKNATLNCGDFEIDEIEISSPPDLVVIRGISAGVSGSLRTSKSVAHEKTTLKQIVQKVATDNSLTVEGTIANITFERITQNRETDLSFLRRLAEKYGFMFSVRGTKLVFADMAEVMSADIVSTIDRNDCTSYSIRDKSAKIYKTATVASYNPVKKKVAKKTYTTTMSSRSDGSVGGGIGGVEFDATPGQEEYWADAQVDDESQAEVVGKSALLQNASNQQEGTVVVPGDPLLVAGVNFEFTGIGKLSGKYHISESEHSVEKEPGYNVTLSIQRVGFIILTKHKRKTPAKKGTYDVTVVK